MFIVGSGALEILCSGDLYRKPKDRDYLCTEYEWQCQSASHLPTAKLVERNDNKGHIQLDSEFHLEFEIAQADSTEMLIKYLENIKSSLNKTYDGYVAPLNVLYMLKMSHRFKRNSPHFYKTMRDIHFMRGLGAEITDDLKEIYKLRQKETYNYSHPNLNVKSQDFFNGDGVPYIYDHDSIHEAVALLDRPAFTYYMQEGAEVLVSMDKFFEVDEKIRLLGVYEETCVLALERSQVPFNFEVDPVKSFHTALMKVCTSITSGRFRTYAWENYGKVSAFYDVMGHDDYVNRFKANQDNLRPYVAKGE